MTQAYAQLLDQLRMVRSTWRMRRVLEGAALAIGCAAAVLLVATMVDQIIDMDRTGRAIVAAAFWATLVGGVWRWIGLPLAVRHNDDYFAAMVEQRLPALGNRLINALQLGRGNGHAAPRLVDAIVHDGLRAVESVEPSAAVTSTVLRQRVIALGVIVLVGVSYFTAAGPGARTSLARVLLPLANISPFTWTQLEVSVDQQRVLEGTPITVSAKTSGRIPGVASLTWTGADGHMRTAAMTPGRTQGAFSYTFSGLTADTTVHVAAGDAPSQPVRLIVDPRPRIERVEIVITPPAYTGRGDEVITAGAGHIHALPGSKATVTFAVSKDLERMTLALADEPHQPMEIGRDARTWRSSFNITQNTTYRVGMRDTQGYDVEGPAYSISIARDAPPVVAFEHPGRDIQLPPDGQVTFAIVATDDLGVGDVRMEAQINPAPGDTSQPITVQTWPGSGEPRQRVALSLNRSVAQLDLKPGDRMQYWAVAFDRNDVAAQGPGRAQSRLFNLVVLTPEQAQALMDKQLDDYAAVVEELIRLQRLNRVETAGLLPASGLVDRQSLIRRQTRQLIAVMQRSAFPGLTIIQELEALAAGDMVRVLADLESYRDRGDQSTARGTLPVQDQIIASLESILDRLNRNQHARQALKKLKEADPVAHRQASELLEKVASELDEFLSELRDIDEKHERLAKRNVDEFSAEDLAALDDVQTRLDRWKKWSKDTVDEITKLPQGFVNDTHLADNVNTIFEEIEKKQRPPTVEIATPLEEGVKALATEVAEDLEMWMPDIGDNVKWVMEDPAEGTFEVPETKLPESLQDMVGDLIEDLADFDEEADDTTGAWGGNAQVGWGIMDGPISSFAALGKTGNQLPNESEMTGRSGAGRRGRASGQMVGSDSPGYEGRPTPARVTNERYEAGNVAASKQLDPRGATGGGKKTGAGRRGLQGGSPPDFVRDMQRLEANQAVLRERAAKVARELGFAGRPSSNVDRALQLLDSAQTDLRDLRYQDAARKRKAALGQLRAAASGVDQAVTLTLQKATDLPPDMRQEIIAGAQQALPEGYEQLVGEYYKALSAGGGDE